MMVERRGLLTQIAVLSLFMMGFGGSIINPGMQQLAKSFPDIPLTTVLLVSTIPALVGIPFTLFSGAIAGRKVKFRPLAWAGLTIMVVAGVTPFFLHQFSTLLLLRGLFGAGYGLMSPIASSLILRLFTGRKRATLMGLGIACMNLTAVVLQIVAGLVATTNVRYMWPIYLFGIVPMIMLLWVPEPQKVERAGGIRFSMPAVGWAYAIVGGILVLLYQPMALLTSTLFDVNHIGSAAVAGIVLSVTMVGYAVGSAASGLVLRSLGRFAMPMSLLMMAAGSGIYAFAGHLPVYVGAAIVGGIGFGLIYPVLMTRVGGSLPLHAVATAMSAFAACVSLGAFMVPYYLRGLGHVTPGFMTKLTFPMLVGSIGLASIAGIFVAIGVRSSRRVVRALPAEPVVEVAESEESL